MEAGNPRLRPESIHSVELGYQMRAEHFSFVPRVHSALLRTMANLNANVPEKSASHFSSRAA